MKWMKSFVTMSKFILTCLDDILPGTREWQWCDRKKIASVPSAARYTDELEAGQVFNGTIQTAWFIVFSERQQRFCAILNKTYQPRDLITTNYGLLLQQMRAEM